MIRTCLLLFVCLALPAVPEQTQPACNDNTKTCRPRVKFLGRLKGCYCFACEAGTKKERNVCTSDPAESQRLQRLAVERRK